MVKASNLADSWDTLPLGDHIDLIKRLIRRVLVSRNELRITISTTHLATELLVTNSLEPDLDPEHSKLDDYETIAGWLRQIDDRNRQTQQRHAALCCPPDQTGFSQ